MDDQDINIKVDKGVIYIDISDKLLFKSGSFDVTDAAKTVLGKVATVLKAQPDIEFMVEGHTDNKPYNRPGPLKDNWDLSASWRLLPSCAFYSVAIQVWMRLISLPPVAG